MRSLLNLTPGQLHLEALRAFWYQPPAVVLDSSAKNQVAASCEVLNQCMASGEVIYGVNTGFGALASTVIPQDALCLLQKKLLLSHAAGIGEPLSDVVVRLMLLLKINALAQGYSGVRYQVIESLLFLLNESILPQVPSRGSVGASGDLAPLAHLSLPLIGEGRVKTAEGIQCPKEVLPPNIIVQLAPKEGLALLNGLQASLAILLDAFFKFETVFEASLLSGALSTKAVGGALSPFDARISNVRRLDAQSYIASVLRVLLEGQTAQSRPRKVQDPYCIRCQPQVAGAILHQLAHIADTLSTEMNAVTDNPLVFTDGACILSGGNFHGELLAFSADAMALLIAELGAISERRIALLIDHHMSGLPPFLVQNSGLNSGFMIAHVTAASCASDNKAKAHPHSVDSLPTSANQEDHVSMATNAALRLHDMLDNTVSIVAIELLAAAEAMAFSEHHEQDSYIGRIYETVRKSVASFDEDRLMGPEIETLKVAIMNGQFSLKSLGLAPLCRYYSREESNQ